LQNFVYTVKPNTQCIRNDCCSLLEKRMKAEKIKLTDHAKFAENQDSLEKVTKEAVQKAILLLVLMLVLMISSNGQVSY
jgi:hypothetical protein